MRDTGAQTTGLVEELSQRRGAKGGIYYRALIHFKAAGSTQRSYYSFSGAPNKNILEKGNRVTIIYNPNKPKRFIITEVPHSNALLIITAIIAAVYIVIAFLLYDYIRQ